jgi:hypothetical protein
MRELLDRAVPPYAGPAGDWKAVLDDAGLIRRRRARLRPAIAVGVVAAAAILAVAWPFSGAPSSIVDRALAAAGSGEVLHLEFESDRPKTLVDLETGARRVVRGRHDVWFDPARGLRERETFEGVTEWDTSMSAAEIHPHALEVYGSLAAGYREALRSGEAKVVGDDVLDGIPVHWIRIVPGHDVAVSRETYLPVFVRVGDGGMRILTYEALDRDAAPLVAERIGAPGGPGIDRGQIPLAEARRVLGRSAVWAGEELHGMRLTSVRRVDLPAGERIVPGVRLVYGPPRGMRIEILQAAEPAEGVTMMAGVQAYVPPEGTLLLDGLSGLVRSNGLVVGIHGPDPETVTAIVRALRPYD